MSGPSDHGPVAESVMAGHGFYGAHSRPQHAAAAVAYPFLERAVAAVPLPPEGRAVVVEDLGCAGGANEMEPLGLALDGLAARGWAGDVEVVHTDLPENDFGPLFALLGGPDSYLAGRRRAYPAVVGRTLYGPLLPDGVVRLGWSGITLHWLSEAPVHGPEALYPNLAAGAARHALRERSARDWLAFLGERARELADGGELVVVAGASTDDGLSGAERLFEVIGQVLAAMEADGALRPGERARISYPTWNRTMAEWLAPFSSGPVAGDLEVVEHRLDASPDAELFPQWASGGDAAGFAAAYVPFVRAVTEVPFFRWLDADRGDQGRAQVVADFYRRLEAALTATPDVAATWHVASLRIRRRPRP